MGDDPSLSVRRARYERSTFLNAVSADPSLPMNAAVKRIVPKVGVVPGTLRGWVPQQDLAHHPHRLRVPLTPRPHRPGHAQLSGHDMQPRRACIGRSPGPSGVVVLEGEGSHRPAHIQGDKVENGDQGGVISGFWLSALRTLARTVCP